MTCGMTRSVKRPIYDLFCLQIITIIKEKGMLSRMITSMTVTISSADKHRKSGYKENYESRMIVQKDIFKTNAASQCDVASWGNLTFFTIGTLLRAGLEAKIILLLIVIPISALPKGGTPTS